MKKILIMIIFITFLLSSQGFNLFSENVLDEKFIEFYQDYVKNNPEIVKKAETQKELDNHVIGVYYESIHKEDSKFNFEKADSIIIFYKEPKKKWINLKYLKIWYKDKVTYEPKYKYHGQPFTYTYEDAHYMNPYQRYKKGLHVCGMYYFFKLADFEALFDRIYKDNHFECETFHTNAKNEINPSLYSCYVKMIINELNNIQLDFYKSEDLMDATGKYVFSIVLIKEL